MQSIQYNLSITPESFCISPVPSIIARFSGLCLEGIGEYHTYPSYFTHRSGLDSHLLLYTFSGTGLLRYQQREYTLLPGHIFWIDCMEEHDYRNRGEGIWSFLYLHFNGAMAPYYYEPYEEHDCPVVLTDCDSTIVQTLSAILSLARMPVSHYDILMQRHLMNLLTDMIIAQDSSLDRESIPAYVRQCVDYIQQNLTSSISLDDLAKQFNISKYHMAKQFKRYMGAPPHEYLINLRIAKAKELLKYTDKTVADIAELVGFHHVNHFINLFQNREKMTPLAYRKKWAHLAPPIGTTTPAKSNL